MSRKSFNFKPQPMPMSARSSETRTTIDGVDLDLMTDAEMAEIYLSQPHPYELARAAERDLAKWKAQEKAKKEREGIERRRESWIEHSVDFHKRRFPKLTAAEIEAYEKHIRAVSYTKDTDDFYR